MSCLIHLCDSCHCILELAGLAKTLWLGFQPSTQRAVLAPSKHFPLGAPCSDSFLTLLSIILFISFLYTLQKRQRLILAFAPIGSLQKQANKNNREHITQGTDILSKPGIWSSIVLQFKSKISHRLCVDCLFSRWKAMEPLRGCCKCSRGLVLGVPDCGNPLLLPWSLSYLPNHGRQNFQNHEFLLWSVCRSHPKVADARRWVCGRFLRWAREKAEERRQEMRAKRFLCTCE